MNLLDVSEELREVLDTIAGLHVPPWGSELAQPPAAIVTLPERIDYNTHYARGKDHYPDLMVVLLAGKPSDRHTIKTLAPFVSGSGPKSIPAVIKAHKDLWVACESVTVDSAEFDIPKFAGADHLAALFHLNIIGRGA